MRETNCVVFSQTLILAAPCYLKHSSLLFIDVNFIIHYHIVSSFFIRDLLLKTCFIVNPKSGAGKAEYLWRKLYPKVDVLFPGSEVVFTERTKHAEEYAKEFIAKGYQKIIAVGGDGTLNEVINGIFSDGVEHHRQITLGSLCLGTGGDFTRSIGLSKDPFFAIDEIKQEKTILTDIIKVQFKDEKEVITSKYFMNASNIGLGGLAAEIVGRSSKKLGGTTTYLLGALQSFFTFKKIHLSLDLDEHKNVYNGEICELVVAKGKYCGAGMMLTPGADLKNGLLEIVLMDSMSKFELLRKLPFVYFGKHIPDKKVHVFRGKNLNIRTKNYAPMDTDGESYKCLPLSFTCVEKAINLIVSPSYH